jgi:hypothetical protein
MCLRKKGYSLSAEPSRHLIVWSEGGTEKRYGHMPPTATTLYARHGPSQYSSSLALPVVVITSITRRVTYCITCLMGVGWQSCDYQWRHSSAPLTRTLSFLPFIAYARYTRFFSSHSLGMTPFFSRNVQLSSRLGELAPSHLAPKEVLKYRVYPFTAWFVVFAFLSGLSQGQHYRIYGFWGHSIGLRDSRFS